MISQEWTLAQILETVRRYWGFEELLPLQEEAVRASLEQRDSLVVLPTGGGKSLCYQVPPLLTDRLDVVVSPLISLMKDQLDALRAVGYPAAALHSGMTSAQRRQAYGFIASGKCRLLLIAPERLVTSGFLELLDRQSVRAFAIDEAHCISHWGHDFRPEYRQLSLLKERFPDAGVHAFTATATKRVRADIVEQLQLRDPVVLIGRFDRPNLTYRVIPRRNLRQQVYEAIVRHPKQAIIVYCITRADTEELCDYLGRQDIRTAYYHAGMEAAARRRVQDDFSNERFDVIVATVAFGMGIDRSDVRCVIHAGMPKSIEHYQQETGRAGRDGLEAECVLFYSPADVIKWKSVLERTAQDADSPPEVVAAAFRLLEHMRQYCSPGRCRHRTLSEYFGQAYSEASCKACDVCLNECEALEDGTVQAQMILSCVARTGQRFGVGHVVDVLRGADTQQIKKLQHDKLSTYGLMKTTSTNVLTHIVYQLIDQGLLVRTDTEYPVLKLNETSREVLRGTRKVYLIPLRMRKVKKSVFERTSWDGIDRGLFEALRGVRMRLARERRVPPFVIFSDATLRELARRTPITPPAFRSIPGVGEKKLADFGPIFMSEIEAYISRRRS